VRVSGIATVFNEENTVNLFFDSYRRQEKYCDELIIVDGGSNDKTVELLEKLRNFEPGFNIKLFHIPESQYNCEGQIALGRNIAIEKAIYEAIVCFDFGCTYSNNYVAEMTSKLIRWKVVGGYYYGLNTKTLFGRAYSNTMMPKKSLLTTGFIPSSRSFAFKKNVWSDVGGYPTKYLTGEDTNFVLNILEAGHTIGYSREVMVGWTNPSTLVSIFQKHHKYGKGKFEFRLMSKSSFILKIVGVIFLFPFTLFNKSLLVRLTVYFAEISGYVLRFLENKLNK